MLPNLSPKQSVYIEITNPVHGGNGWEFGNCLWSPVRDSGHSKAWQIMEEVKANDFIIHLLKLKDGYHWAGISTVQSKLMQPTDSPPKPGKWANMFPYQRVNLDKFAPVGPPVHISLIFDSYKQRLVQILNASQKGLFYVSYGSSKDLRVSQRYLAGCPPDLYQIFAEHSSIIGFSPNLERDEAWLHTQNEPAYPDYSTPGRTETVVSRVIRDTKLIRQLKQKYEWRCQVCNKRISLPSGAFYAEGHHLKPLGGEHQGPDIEPNIIILCPYHHTEFDYGSIAINPYNDRLIHIDPENEFNGKELGYQNESLSNEYLSYHYQKIYKNN